MSGVPQPHGCERDHQISDLLVTWQSSSQVFPLTLDMTKRPESVPFQTVKAVEIAGHGTHFDRMWGKKRAKGSQREGTL